MHAEVDEVLVGAAAQGAVAESAEVLGADVCESSHAVERPARPEVFADGIPGLPDALIGLDG